MRAPTTWHPQLDNPDLIGWSVVAAYGLAALACGWAAVRTGRLGLEDSRVWWFLAAVLLFLGINKQLNLQTLMIVVGRRAAYAGNWYEHRRLVQVIFAAVFALVGVGLLCYFAGRAKRFIRRNQMAFAGVIVLLFFVVLRSSTINHADKLIGVDLKDGHWAWVLEISGSLLLIFSAIAAAKASRRA